MKLTRLKINGIPTPLGYTLDTPTLSWNVEEAKGKQLKNVQIKVTTDPNFEHLVFETSGSDLSCTGTALDFPLEPRTRYYVQLQATDDKYDSATENTWFETGKLTEHWDANWIAPQKKDAFHPIFSKTFFCSDSTCHQIPLDSMVPAEKQVQSARLYICGLGVYEAYLNGKKVGDELLTPYLNDYRFALQTQTYDVTNMLYTASNRLEVYLGNGWYKGRFGQVGKTYGDRFALIAELHLRYTDGSSEVIKTDDSWKYCGSDIEDSGIYDGEILNRLKWSTTGNEWKSVEFIDIDKSLLVDRHSLPVITKETLSVKEIIYTPAGETVLDMGQNFSGWIVFQNHQPNGTKLHFEFGEVLQNGNFYNDNYRSAKGGFTYISNGKSELVRPHFTYFGFRYVKVTGWVGAMKKDDFIGWVLYSDLEQTGSLHTNHAKINQLISNCMWGQKSNFLDMPTDCPQRDERLGWTADAQVFSPTATYNMDTRAFYQKYLWDMRNIQKQMNGAVPAYLPQADGMCPVCSVWGDAATFIPYTLWNFYHNINDMTKLYPLMKNWIDYIVNEMQSHYGKPYGIWDFTFHFGDWLALDGPDEQSVKGATSDGYLATVYYYKSTSIVAEIAEKLGNETDARYYKELAAQIKDCLLYEYFTPAGHLSINTQAAYVVALRFGIYRNKETTISDFLELLELNQYKIKCGFVGAPLLCQVLSECGHSELAYRFLLQEGFPSWLYAVNLGATTIWERWNSLLEDGSISGTGMNSLNHYSYGSVIEFIYAWSAGLRPTKAGFQHVTIAPLPNIHFGKLDCSYLSPNGNYIVNWNIKPDGLLSVHIEVPFDCTATITLPESGKEPFTVSTGAYDYEYMPLHDYRQKFNESNLLSEIFADNEAKEILCNIIPQANALDNPIDALQPISVLYERDFMGITKEMAGEAIEKIKTLKY